MIFKKLTGLIPEDTRHKGLLAALAGCLLISFDPVFIRLSGTSGVDTAFLFGLFTALSMSIVVQATDPRGLLGAVRSSGWPAVLSGLFILGSATCFILSVTFTAVANTMIIMSARPVLTALVSWLFLRERTTQALWLAMAGVMAGIGIVVSGSLASANLVGDGLAVLMVIFLSLNGALLRKYKQMSRTVIVGLAGLFLALTMSLAATPSGYTASTWLIMAAMGLASAPMGRVLNAVSVRYLPAAEAALLSLSTSVLAPVWIFLLFREVPTIAALVGGGVVLATLVGYIRITGKRG